MIKQTKNTSTSSSSSSRSSNGSNSRRNDSIRFASFIIVLFQSLSVVQSSFIVTNNNINNNHYQYQYRYHSMSKPAIRSNNNSNMRNIVSSSSSTTNNNAVLFMSSSEEKPDIDTESSSSSSNSNNLFNFNPNLKSSIIVNTLSILGLSSAFLLFWSECSIVLTNCSPSSLSIPMERSAYISSFLFASGTNLSKIIFDCSMTELLLVDDHDHDRGDYSEKKMMIRPIEKGLFYATEVVAFMAVVSAFAVIVWQIAQGVDNPGSDGGRFCQLMNE